MFGTLFSAFKSPERSRQRILSVDTLTLKREEPEELRLARPAPPEAEKQPRCEEA